MTTQDNDSGMLSGMVVAFMGPDGCGKTTIIQAVETALVPSHFPAVARIHLRPSLRYRTAYTTITVTNPHSAPPRNMLQSLVKICYYWFEYCFGTLCTVLPMKRRGMLVAYDRYAHDLLVDPLRYRYGGPPWVLKLLSASVPMPDLFIFLDASPQVLQARKQEVPFEETARQRDAYLAVAKHLKQAAVVVDATQPVDTVRSACVDAILSIRDQPSLAGLTKGDL